MPDSEAGPTGRPRTEAGKRLLDAILGGSLALWSFDEEGQGYISDFVAQVEAEASTPQETLRDALERIETLPLGHAFHDGPHTELDPLPVSSCAITGHWHQTYRRDHVLSALRATPEPPREGRVDMFATQLQETGTATVFPGDEDAALAAVRAIGVDSFTVTTWAAPEPPRHPAFTHNSPADVAACPTCSAAAAPEPRPDLLDVERLAEAWVNVMDGRRLVSEGLNDECRIDALTVGARDWAAIVAEYAALSETP